MLPSPISQLPSLPNQDSLLEPLNTDTNNSPEPSNTDTNPSMPPNADELAPVFEAFQLHMIEKLPYQPWPKFSLSRAGFSKLEKELNDNNTTLHGYANEKIRYDYIPSRHQLVIRMASNLHEFVSIGLANEIATQLESICTRQSSSGQSSANFARNIGRWGSPTIQPLDPYYGTHVPDASFGHYGTALPALIIEVSWSQKREALPYLANDYLLGSNGNIQIVIGIDLEYNKGSEAALSIWKVAMAGTFMDIEQVVANEIIRGPTVTFAGLRIPLSDFANSLLRAQYQQPIIGDIFISAAQLRTIIDQAETRYLDTKSNINIASLPPGITKRRRERTPLEELHEIDKNRFTASEHRTLENMDAGSAFSSSTLDGDDVSS